MEIAAPTNLPNLKRHRSMHRLRVLSFFVVLAGCAAPGAPLTAQHGGEGHAGGARVAAVDPAVPLRREALGAFSWPVSTRSAEAQAYFDQGVKLMYSFAPAEARRSFAEARRVDPQCAMCWWGEAWAMGPYLNGPMNPADVAPAHAAALRALALARRGAPVERALAQAMVMRYAARHPAGGRRGLDSAFAAAMGRVYERFPDHPHAATLYADALMLLEPRRGTWSLDKPSVARIHRVLEGVLARDLSHPGACHSYIHATETTPKAGAAQACADLLVTAIPRASHVNHMPSHTYNRMGRWADAVRANLLAVRSDSSATAGDGYAIYPAHNLMMLAFSASVDGQGEVAARAAREFAAQVQGGDGASAQATVLTRFGRWGDLLALDVAPRHPIHRGLWAFGRGHAHLRTGAADSARAYLARVDSLAASTPDSVVVRQHTAARLLGVVGGILRGELLRSEGRTDEAVAAFRRAVELEDALVYDEPEPLPFAARDWLGAALLEAGRAAEAERVYRDALADRPANGWSLRGLELSLRAQNRAADADRAAADFRRAWERADVVLPASRF